MGCKVVDTGRLEQEGVQRSWVSDGWPERAGVLHYLLTECGSGTQTSPNHPNDRIGKGQPMTEANPRE